jgi:hypothetical protein
VAEPVLAARSFIVMFATLQINSLLCYSSELLDPLPNIDTDWDRILSNASRQSLVSLRGPSWDLRCVVWERRTIMYMSCQPDDVLLLKP